MLKVSKVGFGALFATIALTGLMASSASAANWHTNGDKAFSSTNAGISRLLIHHAGTTIKLECPTSSGTGTLNGPTSATLPWVSAATVTPVFGAAGNCSVNNVMGYTVACSSAELRANSYAGGDTLGTADGGVTTGAITGVDCRLSAGPTQCSTITGSVTGTYTNPSPLASGSGRLTIPVTGQSLTVSKIGAGCATVPHGVGTFGTALGAGITDTTYTVHGPNAPYIYRGT
jgi:hypothetical protein